MATYTGAQLGARALQAEGVDTVFFMLSAPLVQECIDLGMQAILVRNETGAGMMAHGYARATGRPGVVLTSHGPGTANVVPAVANALVAQAATSRLLFAMARDKQLPRFLAHVHPVRKVPERALLLLRA